MKLLLIHKKVSAYTQPRKPRKKKGGKQGRRKGFVMPLEHKQKISAAKQGIPFEEWKKFVAYEPYCPLFNFKLKERIRNRDKRKCSLCGKSELLNDGKRLIIHHMDADKMQGCNDKKWYLTSLCRSCHNSHSAENAMFFEFLIATNSC